MAADGDRTITCPSIAAADKLVAAGARVYHYTFSQFLPGCDLSAILPTVVDPPSWNGWPIDSLRCRASDDKHSPACKFYTSYFNTLL